MEDDQVSQIWKEAKQRYALATKQDLDDPTFSKPKTLAELHTLVDNQHQDFSDYRDKRKLLFAVMDGALKPIELLGDIAAGGASMAFPPSQLVFGAVISLIKAARGVSACYDAIQDLFVTLKDSTIRLDVHSREEISIELQGKLTDIIVALLEVLGCATKAIHDGRVKKFFKNILSRDKDVEGLVSRLNKLTQSESWLVGAETLVEVKTTGRAINSMSATVNEQYAIVSQIQSSASGLHSEFREFMQEERMDKAGNKASMQLRSLIHLLQPTSTPKDMFESFEKHRVPGTGDWIHDDRDFQRWVGQEIPLLGIYGIPGAGKSFLSSNMISYLQQKHPQHTQNPSQVSVAYFFFKDGNPMTKSLRQALRDLSYQICRSDPVYEHYISHCEPYEISSIEGAWRTLFIDFFESNNQVQSTFFIILDGIDEAYNEDRAVFLDQLESLHTSATSRIRVTIVGRPNVIDEINSALGDRIVPAVSVDAFKNTADIRSYIQTSIKKSRVLKRVGKDLQAEVVEALTNGANGMFKWVDLMIQELNNQERPDGIRESLRNAPEGLTAMYTHVLEGFSSSLKKVAAEDFNEILAWITCATRPLMLGELDSILRLRSPKGEPIIFLEGKLRQQFASFIDLTRDDGMSTGDLQRLPMLNALALGHDNDADDFKEGVEDVEHATDYSSNPLTTVVAFSHASVGDYFHNPQYGQVSASPSDHPVGVDICEAQAHVLKTCLLYFCDKDVASKLIETSEFVLYIKYNWFNHLQVTNRSSISVTTRIDIGKMLMRMMREEDLIFVWAGGLNWLTFADDSHIQEIRSWLNDPEVFAVFDEDQKEWLNSMKSKPLDAILPATRLWAQQWLVEVDWEVLPCCSIILAVLALFRGEAVGTATTTMIPSAEEILSAAEWCEFEKTSGWNRRLAMTFREAGHLDEALEYFHKALESDPDEYLIYGGIARVHQIKQEAEQAIEWQKQSVTVHEKHANDDVNDTKVFQGFSNNFIAECYDEIGDSDNAILYYNQAFEADHSLYDSLAKVIVLLETQKKYQEVIDLVKNLAEDEPNTSHTQLTELLWKDRVGVNLARICEKLGQTEFFFEAYGSAIKAALDEKQDPLLALTLEWDLAKLYSKIKDYNRACLTWQAFIRNTVGCNHDTELFALRNGAGADLALILFNHALEAGEGTTEANHAISQLEDLCKQKPRDQAGEQPAYVNSIDTVLYLSAWYHLTGRIEEARTQLRGHVKLCLQILNDDDPDNDSIGIYRLAFVMLILEEDENAAALFRLNDQLNKRKLVEARETEKQATLVNECADEHKEAEVKEGDRGKDEDASTEAATVSNPAAETEETANGGSFACDGPCSGDLEERLQSGRDGRSLAADENMYICRYCMNLGYCEDCIKLVQSGEHYEKYTLCHPKHRWMKMTPGSEPLEAGKIKLGEKTMNLEAWKKSLQRQWKV